MSGNFERRYGVVSEILDNGRVRVDVKRNHACVGCSGANSCGVAEDPGFSAEVKGYDGVAAGDRVEVIIPTKDLYRSVGLMYVLPIALVLVIALAVDAVFGTDIVTALVSLGFLGAYFVVLKGVLGRRKQRDTIIVRPVVSAEEGEA